MNEFVINQGTPDEGVVSFEVYSSASFVGNAGVTNALAKVDARIDAGDSIEMEFDKSVSKADRRDYEIAAACGLLMGAVSSLFQKDLLPLEETRQFGSEMVNDFVMAAAEVAQSPDGKKWKRTGGEGDLRSAIAFLEKSFPNPSDSLMDKFGGSRQHHHRDFSHHASPAGLLFSILTQFTEEGYGTNTDGEFIHIPLPKGAVVGKNFTEKIFFGTVNWFFHLASDMAGSKSAAGAGTGIPGPILSILKELSSRKLFKDKKIAYEDKEVAFYVWTAKLFNGSRFKTEDGKAIPFDLRMEVGHAAQGVSQAKWVLINECLVRGSYFLIRLSRELSSKRLRSFADLSQVDPQAVLPFNNRALTRMLTMSSTTFALTNLAQAAARAAIESNGNKEKMLKAFLVKVNYAGIVRLVIACAADARYIAEDAGALFESVVAKQAARAEDAFSDFKLLALDDYQTRVLYSLEFCSVKYDIARTKNEKSRAAKIEWLEAWSDQIASALGYGNADFLSTDEESLLKYLSATEGPGIAPWFSLLMLELQLFTPYTPLGLDCDDHFAKLKKSSDYLKDVVLPVLCAEKRKKAKEIEKAYARAERCVSGSRNRAVLGVAITVGATAATGGIAFAFAPEIAALLVGEAVAGLSGAALTNASLAIIGGGALAAGGFGVAGGTAVLVGGGALVGLASSSVVSFTSTLLKVDHAFVLNECSKLLAICSVGITNDDERTAFALKAADRIARCADETSRMLESYRGQKDKKKEIKKLEVCLRYFERCSKELLRMSEA